MPTEKEKTITSARARDPLAAALLTSQGQVLRAKLDVDHAHSQLQKLLEQASRGRELDDKTLALDDETLAELSLAQHRLEKAEVLLAAEVDNHDRLRESQAAALQTLRESMLQLYEILQAHRSGNETQAEIAQRLGVSQSAVSRGIQRAVAYVQGVTQGERDPQEATTIPVDAVLRMTGMTRSTLLRALINRSAPKEISEALGVPLEEFTKLFRVHHIKPIKDGGSDDLSNLRVSPEPTAGIE
jgi:hypothetical protein